MRIISNQKNRKIIKWSIFFFPVSLIAVFVFYQVYFGFYEDFFSLLQQKGPTIFYTDVDLGWYHYILLEDGPVENATAIAFILSGGLGFVITTIFFKKGNKKFGILYLLLAIGFLVLGMEEISWAQRIFNLETPESFSSNLQDQITVHNIKSVKAYLHDFLMMVGFFGAFSWLIFKKWEGTKHNSFVRIFVPPWYLMFYFFPIFIFYLMGIFMPFDHQRWELGDWLPMNDQEPPELVLALGCLLFAGVSLVRQKVIFRRDKTLENI